MSDIDIYKDPKLLREASSWAYQQMWKLRNGHWKQDKNADFHALVREYIQGKIGEEG
jgi:hypothetical protein